MQESTLYQILKYIQDKPEITQRELAQKTGFSLGKINYCLHALIEEGLIKAGNFKNYRSRSAYNLTPKGIEEKIRVSSIFFKEKFEEYEALKAEIEKLRSEAGE